MDNIKITGLNNNYLDEMNKQLENKYTIFDATHSNQYLDMEFINDK